MDNRYQLYLASCMKLIETLVVKSVETVDGLNKLVTDYHGIESVDVNRPETWKYYLNISGEYHQTDTPMEVVSWDTLEKIIFNKENLAIHRATFRAYSYGTQQYSELVKRFPNQENLILGILNPVNIEKAIAAENGSILAYDKGLVEVNEYSLIDRLEKWIKSYKVRWVNEQFMISDELYAATHHGIMFLNLVPVLLNLRLEACKTNEAHSYHITEYLLSHGIPATSIMHMTKKQMLFFYRNIRYIQKNAGKQSTFDWLVEHIMTERNLPLSEFVMKHDDESQLLNLTPDVRFKNRPLNTIYGALEAKYITLNSMLEKESTLLKGNVRAIDEDREKIQEVLENSLSNTVMTKVLESSIIDYTESGQNKPEEVLLQHWLYLSTKGIYNTFIGVQNPATGERIPLSAKDAFTLMIYAFARAIDIEPIYVPVVPAIRVQRMPKPTIDQLMSLVDEKYIKRDFAEKILSYSPDISPIISTEAFNALGMKIYQAILTHYHMPAIYEHEYRRGLAKNMILGVYADILCPLEPEGTTYASWFATRNLDFTSFNRTDFEKLHADIVVEATGMNLQAEPNLQSLQKAMIRLFESISSYSIQFVDKINNEGLVNLNNYPARIGNIGITNSGIAEVYDAVSELQGVEIQSKQTLEYDVTPIGVRDDLSIVHHYRAQLEAPVEITFKPKVIYMHYHMNAAPVQFNSIEILVP